MLGLDDDATKKEKIAAAVKAGGGADDGAEFSGDEVLACEETDLEIALRLQREEEDRVYRADKSNAAEQEVLLVPSSDEENNVNDNGSDNNDDSIGATQASAAAVAAVGTSSGDVTRRGEAASDSAAVPNTTRDTEKTSHAAAPGAPSAAAAAADAAADTAAVDAAAAEAAALAAREAGKAPMSSATAGAAGAAAASAASAAAAPLWSFQGGFLASIASATRATGGLSDGELATRLALSESKLLAVEAEAARLRRQLSAANTDNAWLRRELAVFTSVDRHDVETGALDTVSLPHDEAAARARKRGAGTALEALAETTELVVRVKKERVEFSEELEDTQDLTMFQALHSDRLMSHIEALKAQVVALGGVPVGVPAKAAS